MTPSLPITPLPSRRDVLQAAGLAVGALAVAAGSIWVPDAVATGIARQHFPRNMVSVASPAYCSTINGNTVISVVAPGLNNATAKCWKQGPGLGADSTLAELAFNTHGEASFTFPADHYPHGPITIRIAGRKQKHGAVVDRCYLQLYNAGGVRWAQGLPKAAAPQAKGMSVVFADDFTGPLSISSTNVNATYYDHKPPHGWQDFSSIPFTGFHQPNNPFLQMDTWLRIRANAPKNSTGLISSIKENGRGVTAKAPCYFECRFIGPNAPGAWPAFWLLTNYMIAFARGKNTNAMPVDELDIIEAYGGNGPHEPNSFDKYQVTPHAWNQGAAGNMAANRAYHACHDPIVMKKFGIPSTWYQASHIYGCKITKTWTHYYCDNIEVCHHHTLPQSKIQPFFFLINLATGGGWPVNLSRYNGLADMYVDYVRVWQG